MKVTRMGLAEYKIRLEGAFARRAVRAKARESAEAMLENRRAHRGHISPELSPEPLIRPSAARVWLDEQKSLKSKTGESELQATTSWQRR
jgi:hypothetical protein